MLLISSVEKKVKDAPTCFRLVFNTETTRQCCGPDPVDIVASRENKRFFLLDLLL